MLCFAVGVSGAAAVFDPDSTLHLEPQIDVDFHADRHALLSKAATPKFAHVLSTELMEELKLIENELKTKRELRNLVSSTGATAEQLSAMGVGSQAADLMQQIETAKARQALLLAKAKLCQERETFAAEALLAAAKVHSAAQDGVLALNAASKAISPLAADVIDKQSSHQRHKDTVNKALASLQPESADTDFLAFETLAKELQPHNSATEAAVAKLTGAKGAHATAKGSYEKAALRAKLADKEAQIALSQKAAACGTSKLKKATK